MALPIPVQKLIDEFNKLPGIGQKTAERFVFYLLKQPKTEIIKLIGALNNINNRINVCSECFNYCEKAPCPICSDKDRDQNTVCVVAESADIIALEKVSEYRGVYHVLHGQINHIDDIGPEKLKIKELVSRIKKNKIKEVILALDANMDGETTVLYLNKTLKPLSIKITRLARGLPMGSDIEYADEITLASALSGRREI